MKRLSSNPPGGLLSRLEIRRRCEKGELMTEWSCKMLRPAGYNVRIANDGLVTPEGKIFVPVNLGGQHTYDRVLWLAPGQEAELSSREKFDLPHDIAGNITIRTELSGQGLLLLSGLLIDPGYGPSEDDDGKPLSDGRLHFFVANIGPDPIPLTPGETPIAAVQFFRVVGGQDPKAPTEEKTPAVARWEDPRPTSRLGFLANLKDLQDEHAELVADVQRTRDLTQNLLVFGYFLLAATVLGLTLNVLLSVGSDATLVAQVSRAVPDSVSGKALMAAALVTSAWLVSSVARFVLSGRTPPIPTDDKFWYLRARQDLVVDRRRRRAAILFVAGLLAFCIAWAAIKLSFADEELLWAALGTALGCAVLYADGKLVAPVDAHAVRERTQALRELNG